MGGAGGTAREDWGGECPADDGGRERTALARRPVRRRQRALAGNKQTNAAPLVAARGGASATTWHARTGDRASRTIPAGTGSTWGTAGTVSIWGRDCEHCRTRDRLTCRAARLLSTGPSRCAGRPTPRRRPVCTSRAPHVALPHAVLPHADLPHADWSQILGCLKVCFVTHSFCRKFCFAQCLGLSHVI